MKKSMLLFLGLIKVMCISGMSQPIQFVDVLHINPSLMSDFERSRERIERKQLQDIGRFVQIHGRQGILNMYTNDLNARNAIMRILSSTKLRSQITPLSENEWERRAIFLMLPMLDSAEQVSVLEQLTAQERQEVAKLSPEHQNIINRFIIPPELLREVRVGNFSNLLTFLEAGIDVNSRGRLYPADNLTLLHFAAMYGNLDAVRTLIAHGANVNARDEIGITPLHGAASKDVISLLVKHGAHVNAQNNKGSTPLHIAAFAGEVEAVISLLEQGAHVNARNKKGETPLQNARKNAIGGNVADLLIERGAEV